jgi:hypothetical protein
MTFSSIIGIIIIIITTGARINFHATLDLEELDTGGPYHYRFSLSVLSSYSAVFAKCLRRASSLGDSELN